MQLSKFKMGHVTWPRLFSDGDDLSSFG